MDERSRTATGVSSELTERDEELLAENIALQNGTCVEEYQKRIAHKFIFSVLLPRFFIAGQIKNSLIISGSGCGVMSHG